MIPPTFKTKDALSPEARKYCTSPKTCVDWCYRCAQHYAEPGMKLVRTANGNLAEVWDASRKLGDSNGQPKTTKTTC